MMRKVVYPIRKLVALVPVAADVWHNNRAVAIECVTHAFEAEASARKSSVLSGEPATVDVDETETAFRRLSKIDELVVCAIGRVAVGCDLPHGTIPALPRDRADWHVPVRE